MTQHSDRRSFFSGKLDIDRRDPEPRRNTTSRKQIDQLFLLYLRVYNKDASVTAQEIHASDLAEITCSLATRDRQNREKRGIKSFAEELQHLGSRFHADTALVG